MPTTIKADVHRYSVELHDLAVILLHDPKYPLQASLFLYLLALTDKLRRGQIARILGTHPMNSDAVGKLFRVNGSTVRRHFKHMIDVDLLRYSETTSEAKDGRPPVKRRHYTVMTGKLRQASTALSKDIAKSNKIGVMARRMNVDPPERLAVTDNGLMWISASVHVCTEGETEAQRACTHALYPTVKASGNKSTGSIYSGVTPEKNTLIPSEPSADCHIEVTPASAAHLVLPDLPTQEGGQESPITDVADVTPTQLKAIFSPSNTPDVAKAETVADRPATATPEPQAGHIPAGVTPSMASGKVAKIIALAKAQGKSVDPIEMAFEMQAGDGMSDDERIAVSRVRNWGLAGPDEAALVYFVTKCKVYPTSASKGMGSRTTWMAAVQAIAGEGAMQSFIEACDVAFERAKGGKWMIVSPFSIKAIAVDIQRLKRSKQWVGVKEHIRAMNGITADVKAEKEDSGNQVVHWISRQDEADLMAARTVQGRRLVYERVLPNVELVVKGDELGQINESNFIGPKSGVIRVK